MRLFSTRKPRGFNHKYIYYDERRERLKAIEERARREMGMEPAAGYDPERLRGAFSSAQRHVSRARERRAEGRPRVHTAVLVFILIALLALLRYIL